MLTELKYGVRYRPWVTGHSAFLISQVFDHQRNARHRVSDEEHLRAASRWLAAAQDSHKDGGIAGSYHLDRGWTSSYPETTGYTVPSLLALSQVFPEADFRERAERAIKFLLSVQLPEGGFPGFGITDHQTAPMAFDTGQILHGLTAWHRETGEEEVRLAAVRAVRWLLSVQDPDGAFRRYTYQNSVATYFSYLGCWLAEWGDYAGDNAALVAAGRHLDWTLAHRRTNDWIALTGFDAEQHQKDETFTHTLAYTIAGILSTAVTLRRDDGVAAALASAERIARRLEISGFLPGLIGSDWKGRSRYGCLTGNCQLALVWFRLHGLSYNLRLINAALKAIDLVKLAQPMRNANPGLYGGIPGSDPIYGGYVTGAMPNWAVKFFIDAILAKRSVLSDLEAQVVRPPTAVGAASGPVIAGAASGNARRVKTVMLTDINSRKLPRMLTAWGERGIGELTVIVERPAEKPAMARLQYRLRDEGLSWIGSRLRTMTNSEPRLTVPVSRLPDVFAYCRSHGIAAIETGPLDSAGAIAAVRALAPDLGIHAGAGILRQSLIDCFRLGVLNAHMGILPDFRGVSVTQWAALQGAPVGCAVHWIDSGIDTGPILATREVEISGCNTIAALLDAVDSLQMALLAEIAELLVQGKVLRPMQVSRPPGPQYFRMHDDLAAILEARLTKMRRSPQSSPSSSLREREPCGIRRRPVA